MCLPFFVFFFFFNQDLSGSSTNSMYTFSYAAVLRPLRQIAHNVTFRKVPTLTIAKRLHTICEMESLTADMRSLNALCEITDGDIRSCLNTLQFIRGKSTTFSKDMIEHTPLGKKDVGKTLNSVWNDIFNARSAKKNRAFGATALDENENAYVSRISEAAITNGEYERLMQGRLVFPKALYLMSYLAKLDCGSTQDASKAIPK